MDIVTAFPYKQVDSSIGEIRLITIHPAVDKDSPVSCEIEHVLHRTDGPESEGCDGNEHRNHKISPSKDSLYYSENPSDTRSFKVSHSPEDIYSRGQRWSSEEENANSDHQKPLVEPQSIVSHHLICEEIQPPRCRFYLAVKSRTLRRTFMQLYSSFEPPIINTSSGSMQFVSTNPMNLDRGEQVPLMTQICQQFIS